MGFPWLSLGSLLLSVADGDDLSIAAPFLQGPVASGAIQHHGLTLLEAQTLMFQVLLVPGGPVGLPGLGLGVADGDGLGLAAPLFQEPVAAVAVQHHGLTLLEAQPLMFQILLVLGGPMGFPWLGLGVADGNDLGLALQEPVATIAVQHHGLTFLEAQTLLFQVLLVPGGPVGFPGLGFGGLLGGRHSVLLLFLFH